MNSQTDPLRASRPETFLEFERQLGRLFPQSEVTRFEGPGPNADTLAGANPKQIVVTLAVEAEDCKGVVLTSSRAFHAHEMRLAKLFGSVFAADLASAPLLGRHMELWLSLQQTRFARIIARFTSFHTPLFVKWLRTLENAALLRYENTSFSTSLILAKQEAWVSENPAITYVGFDQPISLTQAIFEEKWSRSLASSDALSLVGLGHDRGIIGVAHIDRAAPAESLLIPPHTSLAGFCAILAPGTIGMLVSPRGDLRVLLPNGATFAKSQGHWAMVNLRLLHDELATLLSESVAAALTRLASDLSYEGHGALLCCLEDARGVSELVPDHAMQQRPGKALRQMCRKLNVTSAGHREMLASIAKIDGAIILGPDGDVLDCACMVSDPTDEKLSLAGISERKRFSGARSTAAWNASIHGIAIKISEDGPITLFRKGKLVLQL